MMYSGSIPQYYFNEDTAELELGHVYIKRVLYNDPATIVFWSDNTKTVTKCSPLDVYSPETGLALCLLKKILSKDEVHEILEDWIPTEKLPDDTYNGIQISLRDLRKKYRADPKWAGYEATYKAIMNCSDSELWNILYSHLCPEDCDEDFESVEIESEDTVGIDPTDIGGAK